MVKFFNLSMSFCRYVVFIYSVESSVVDENSRQDLEGIVEVMVRGGDEGKMLNLILDCQ
jgi:hypothetical protein